MEPTIDPVEQQTLIGSLDGANLIDLLDRDKDKKITFFLLNCNIAILILIHFAYIFAYICSI
nr:hypothetical protein [Ectobacillus panaciterrae]